MLANVLPGIPLPALVCGLPGFDALVATMPLTTCKLLAYNEFIDQPADVPDRDSSKKGTKKEWQIIFLQ